MLTPVLGALGTVAPALMALNAKGLSRSKPHTRNALQAEAGLEQALTDRVQEISPGRRDPVYDYDSRFQNKGFLDAFLHPGKYGGSKYDPEIDQYLIARNPNADRAYLAHEMGHIASQQTDIGRLVNNLKHNPKLSMALGASMFGIPAVASALEAGDDDLDSSIAIAALANVPTLVDEGLATKNALAMMDSAGMRATMGQRGKLAGGLLSYAALPLALGVGGNIVGNELDQPSPTELTP